MQKKAKASLKGAFIPVVFENDALFVLDKPSGTPSIPQEADESETAVGAALAHFSEISEVGRMGLEPGILHRLDTLTSGLLVFAKSETEYRRLHSLWKKGAVRKYYRALVSQKISAKKTGKALSAFELSEFQKSQPISISLPMGHNKKSSKRMVALFPNKKNPAIRGKPLPAVTIIHSSQVRENEIFDLELEIKTGVMHQIRCHLASEGWPIVGDPIYHGAPSSRLWLHAWKLEIPTESGEVLRIESKLPEGWVT